MKKERWSKKKVKVPVKWQSAPDHPSTKLAYITDAEAELLKRLDLHGSGVRYADHYGPDGVPSYNGGGSNYGSDDDDRDQGSTGSGGDLNGGSGTDDFGGGYSSPGGDDLSGGDDGNDLSGSDGGDYDYGGGGNDDLSGGDNSGGSGNDNSGNSGGSGNNSGANGSGGPASSGMAGSSPSAGSSGPGDSLSGPNVGVGPSEGTLAGPGSGSTANPAIEKSLTDKYNSMNLRGPTGPLGEPRTAPTSYGTNYQTAQMVSNAYPNIATKHSVTDITKALNELAGALPGEADVNRLGTAGMHDLAKVGLNSMVRNQSPDTMLGNYDTTGRRPGTQKFATPGPNSMGMQPPDSPLQTLATSAIQDALFNRGVSPAVRNATNFWAEGTKAVPGVTPGATINGTTFGYDPGAGNFVVDRNEKAEDYLSGESDTPGTVKDNPLSGVQNSLPSSGPASTGMEDIESLGLSYDPTQLEIDVGRIAALAPPNRNIATALSPDVISGVGSMIDDLPEGSVLTSGYRDPFGNKRVGGVNKSQHIMGNAMDISMPGATPQQAADVINRAKELGFTGIGAYGNEKVHIDTGPVRSWGPDTTGASIGNLSSPVREAITTGERGFPKGTRAGEGLQAVYDAPNPSQLGAMPEGNMAGPQTAGTQLPHPDFGGRPSMVAEAPAEPAPQGGGWSGWIEAGKQGLQKIAEAAPGVVRDAVVSGAKKDPLTALGVWANMTFKHPEVSKMVNDPITWDSTRNDPEGKDLFGESSNAPTGGGGKPKPKPTDPTFVPPVQPGIAGYWAWRQSQAEDPYMPMYNYGYYT